MKEATPSQPGPHGNPWAPPVKPDEPACGPSLEEQLRQKNMQIQIAQEKAGNVLEISRDKELRRGIDHQLQELKCLPSSRERSLAITKLQEAIMWLGMDLKRLGAENPYPTSYDPTSPIVEPTADGLSL